MLKELYKKFTKKEGSRGFTLIELLVVMVIIAVLVTIIIVAIMAARMQQRNTQRRAFANNMKAALEAYYANNKSYPVVTTIADAYQNGTLNTALSSYWGGTASFLSNSDPSDQNWRVRYCGGLGSALGTSRYVIWVGAEQSLLNSALPSNRPGCDNAATAGWEAYGI